MTSAPMVAVDTGHAWVLIDYRTGHTELHVHQPEKNRRQVIVHLERPSPSWGTAETAAVLPSVSGEGLFWRMLCLPVFAVIAVVLAVGPRKGRLRRLVALACSGRQLRPAPIVRVRAALNAVRSVSAYLPGRWACLEQSVATALLLALSGKRAEWRHGLATDPVRLHAWIADSSGRPVDEGPDIDAYTSIHTTDGPGPVPGRILEKPLE